MASYCLHVFHHLTDKSNDYQHLYLDFNAYESNQVDPSKRRANKCRSANLIISNGDKSLKVPLHHIICHRGPIIVRADVPHESQFFDDISMYIFNNFIILVLERVDENNSQLLKYMETCISSIKAIELPVPTPQSTYNTETINEDFLRYE